LSQLGDDRLSIDPATDVIWDGKRITVENEKSEQPELRTTALATTVATVRPLETDLVSRYPHFWSQPKMRVCSSQVWKRWSGRRNCNAATPIGIVHRCG